MRQYIPHTRRHLIILGLFAVATLTTGCSDKTQQFKFKTPQEAISTCRQELATVQSLKKADIGKLTEVTAKWVALQDSVHSLMLRDSTLTPSSGFTVAYYGVADSIRTAITRLALSEKRSMAEVFSLKVNVGKTMDLRMEQKDVSAIRTVIDKMIADAETCRKHIKANKPLTSEQANKYRWQLIQPYLTIDNYATSALTDKQVETLTAIANELPRLLAYVDGKDYEKSPKEQTDKLATVLSEYFLKSYLASVL